MKLIYDVPIVNWHKKVKEKKSAQVLSSFKIEYHKGFPNTLINLDNLLKKAFHWILERYLQWFPKRKYMQRYICTFDDFGVSCGLLLTLKNILWLLFEGVGVQNFMFISMSILTASWPAYDFSCGNKFPLELQWWKRLLWNHYALKWPIYGNGRFRKRNYFLPWSVVVEFWEVNKKLGVMVGDL